MKKKKKIELGQIVLNAFFVIIAVCYLAPFAILVMVSLTDETALYQNGYRLIPEKLSTLGYELVFAKPDQIIQGYITTITFSVIATLLSLLVMALLAYPLSRPNFLWKKQLNFLVYFTMLFNGGMVPTYLLITNVLHINNTILVYILPSLVSAYNVMIIRTNYRSIPDELIEAAKIDGAKELFICFKIIIPLAKPGLASVAFLYFVNKWNDWMTSMLYIKKQELYSLQYLLQRILREVEYLKNSVGVSSFDLMDQPPVEALRFAMALVAAGPVLVIFPLFQKYFTKGLTVGGIKG